MAAHVLAKAPVQPDKPALMVVGADAAQEWTYGALAQAVRGTATGLLQSGLARGDRVLMRLDNTPEFPICYLACIAVGLIPIPTSAQLTTPEVTAIARDTRPHLVVAAPGMARPVVKDIPVIESAALAAFHDLPPAEYDMGDPNRPAYIIYTSGTGGMPRAVVHAHRAVWARQMMWDGWYGLRADDRLMHAGAFNWTYTLGTGLMDPWAAGATALIPAPGTRADALPVLLQRHDATIFAAAPGVYRQILRADPVPTPTLRHGLSAGEKLPTETRRRWQEVTGTTIHEAYGMSECSTYISGAPDRVAPEDTLGYPQPGRRVALIGADGQPADEGVIAVHRSDPGLMLGYLDQPEETAARFAGEWFLTGDIGARSADGAIAYLGRNDDMMNAGGYRVSPIEVEGVLGLHPQIHEVAACEVRVKADTSVIAAFYTAAAPLDETALQTYAAANLARYKCPRIYVHVDALPRGANNKLLRRALRRDWEAAHGQT